MTRLSILYIVLFISILSHSCRKDIDEIDYTPPNIPPISKVVSSIHGTVTDNSGNGVIGAVVYFEDETALTDENGVFKFVDKVMNENGTFLSVEKDGYFKGSRRMYPSVGSASMVQIELISLDIVGNFNSSDAATISHNGVVLEFSKNSIEKEDGSVYDGNVNVAAAYLDPTDPNTLDQMPGDLTGISIDETFVVLKSLGMIAVELTDDNGNELQVKDDHSVNVQIPIPADLQATAPATIPMWHFDEEEGIWEEEEIAYLAGDHYETSLSHFSFWNCDIPQDFVFLEGAVYNRDSYAQGVTVMILDNNNNTSAYSTTDAKGEFRGYIPNNAELTLIIYDQCGMEMYSQPLVTTTEDITLDAIILFLTINYANLTGSVSYCSGELSAYTYIIVEDGINTYTFPMASDGTFNGNVFFCNPGQPIGVTAYDPIQGLKSAGYFYEVDGDISLGNIELCEQAFVEHIIIEYGDVKWNLPFDDKLTNIFNYDEDLFGEGNAGFLLRSAYQPVMDSIHIFKLDINYVEGSTQQDVKIEYIDDFDQTGNGAYGPASSQLIMKDGVEYLLTTGTVSSPLPFNPLDLANEPMYFHVLIENN